VTKSGGKKST